MRDSDSHPTPRSGDVVNSPGHPFHGFTVVSSYSRAQAIEDGVLADATVGDLAEVLRQHFPGIHVAMTAAVFGLIERAMANPNYANDWRGVWHDVLSLCRFAVVKPIHGGRLFRVIIAGAGRKRLHTLRAVIHAGDSGEPCLTIMLPEED